MSPTWHQAGCCCKGDPCWRCRDAANGGVDQPDAVVSTGAPSPCGIVDGVYSIYEFDLNPTFSFCEWQWRIYLPESEIQEFVRLLVRWDREDKVFTTWISSSPPEVYFGAETGGRLELPEGTVSCVDGVLQGTFVLHGQFVALDCRGETATVTLG